MSEMTKVQQQAYDLLKENDMLFVVRATGGVQNIAVPRELIESPDRMRHMARIPTMNRLVDRGLAEKIDDCYFFVDKRLTNSAEVPILLA